MGAINNPEKTRALVNALINETAEFFINDAKNREDDFCIDDVDITMQAYCNALFFLMKTFYEGGVDGNKMLAHLNDIISTQTVVFNNPEKKVDIARALMEVPPKTTLN